MNDRTAELTASINEALERDMPGAKLRHDPHKPAMPPTSTLPERTPRAQLEAFMSSSANMLEIQRRNIIQTESAYQLDRLKLLDDYRIRIETLKNECADAVRALDQKHRSNLADSQNLLDRLAAMRALD